MLILADRADELASAVAVEAAGHGVEVRWLSTVELLASRWQHVVDGAVTTWLTDPLGRDVDLDGHGGVLNRLSWVPPVPFRRPKDRDYSTMERHALLLSVLAALRSPVVNAPCPPSLSGPVLGPAAWLALAGSAGASVRRLRITTDGLTGGHVRAGNR